MKRTPGEKEALALQLNMLKAMPEFKLYEKEVLRIKDAVASGLYKESGDNMVKNTGIIRGIDIALGIEKWI